MATTPASALSISSSNSLLKPSQYGLPGLARCIQPFQFIHSTETAGVHRFITATCTPILSNQILILEFGEENENIDCILKFSHSDQVHALSSNIAHPQATESDLVFFTGSRDTQHSKNERCRLWSAAFNPTTNTSLTCLTEIQSSKKPFSKIKGILPHQQHLKADSDILTVVDSNGFHTFQCSNSKYDLMITGSTEGRTCNAGKLDPLHSKLLATVDASSIIGWDLRSLGPVYKSRPGVHSPGGVLDIEFNPNVAYQIATGGEDGRILIWDLRNMSQSVKIINKAHTHWVQQLKINPFHDHLVVSCGSDNIVQLHSIENNRHFQSSLQTDEKDHEVATNEAMLQNHISNGRLVKSYTGHDDSVYGLAWSASDAWCFASVSNDGRVDIQLVPSEEKYRILL